ncbi:MAG: ATP-grasp domain-containing protein [Solirubrobacterales bacterium]
MRDKVFVLGAGRGQIPIIEICKKNNFETIVVSKEGDYPGFQIADRCYYIDVKDKAKVLEAAQKEKISAILSDQLDACVQTIAYVAEKMDLPGIGYEASLKFTNKYIMKQEAQKLGVEVPKYNIVFNLEEACSKSDEMGYPVVIKPPDQEGSRGVIKINNRIELEKNFEDSFKLSQSGYIEIEKYIQGTEYIALGFAQNYQYTNLAISQYLPFKSEHYFVPKMKTTKAAQSVTDEVELRILNKTKKLVQGFGMKFGIAQAEFLYDKTEDKIYLVEIAARGGGMFTSSDVIPLTCGINIIELLVDFATNKTQSFDFSKLSSKVAGYICFSLPEGRITEIGNVDKLMEIPGVYKVYLDTIHVGKEIGKMVDKSMRIGPILFYGNTEDECNNTIEKVKETLKISVCTLNEGVKGIIW